MYAPAAGDGDLHAVCTRPHTRNTQSIIAGNARHIIPCTEIAVCIIV